MTDERYLAHAKVIEEYVLTRLLTIPDIEDYIIRGAEVGVREGDFSAYLLEAFPTLKMILVDPYLPYLDLYEYYDQARQDAVRLKAIEQLKPFEDRVEMYYHTSMAAAINQQQTPGDNKLDFVFIDAKHTFEAVYEDCHEWSKLVRVGGFIAGHDIQVAEVSAGVEKFRREVNGTEVSYPHPANVWIIQKDKQWT